MATRIITPVCILSYPHLDKVQTPIAGSSGPPKFGAVFVFTDLKDIATLQAAANEAFEAAITDPNKRKQMQASPGFKSGFRTDVANYESIGGKVYINARSDTKPGAVYAYPDESAEPDPTTGRKPPKCIPDERYADDLYPGAKVRASVTAFYFDKAGNRGIGWALNNVQKIGDGVRLDSRRAADAEFEATEDALTGNMDDMVS